MSSPAGHQYDPYSAPMDMFVVDAQLQERLAFLRRVYTHVFGAILLLIGLEFLYFQTPIATTILQTFGRMWFIALIGVIAACWFAQKLACSGASAAAQYGGLGLYVFAESIFLVPAIGFALFRDPNILGKAAFLTFAITGGLTLVVIVSRKDFSFLRNALYLGGIALFAIGIASFFFGGFSLGILFSALVVVLMCGYILYETSLIMNHLPTTAHVAGALMIFGSMAELFRHLIYIMSFLNDD
ncbi:MAG: Bax inhibitor-1 family protein [Planctomycetaceae bacterium]